MKPTKTTMKIVEEAIIETQTSEDDWWSDKKEKRHLYSTQ